jgi:hypothetical protein
MLIGRKQITQSQLHLEPDDPILNREREHSRVKRKQYERRREQHRNNSITRELMRHLIDRPAKIDR